MFLARQAFDKAFHPSTTWTVKLGTTVTVTGVYFSDRQHGQRGIAANGAELHPVTMLRVGP